jgi:ribose/xylose/arabinose/galactoside ABC-type transport system permease subunit
VAGSESADAATVGTSGTGLARINVRRVREQLRVYVPFLALILLTLIFTLLEPNLFFTLRNARVILSQSAVLSIVGFGLTFVIVAGSIDLSVGSVMALAGMLGMGVLRDVGVVPGLVTGLLVGTAAGLFNGAVFTYLRIPSFVVTLGMLTMARGLTIMYSRGAVILVPDGFATAIGRFPNIYYVVLIAFVICHVLYNYTTFGRYVQGIGGDERVAILTGVAVNRTKVLMFVLCGLLAGLGGVLLASRVGAATPTAGVSFELDAIAAVVVGGTPLTGGIGNVYNTVLGALIISMLGNGLVIMGVSSEAQQVIKGLVLIAAVFISLERAKIGIIK